MRGGRSISVRWAAKPIWDTARRSTITSFRSRRPEIRYAFIFDQNKCTGCQACQLACTIENGLEPDRSWRAVYTFNEQRQPGIPLFHLSLACNHCADAPCMSACPALAYERDGETGAVLIDRAKCIGCRYCSWACPYDAPRFDTGRGVMTKCTFCNERLKQGLSPACADLCPTGALSVAEAVGDQVTEGAEGFPKADIGPSIRIIPLRVGGRAPESSLPAGIPQYTGAKSPSHELGLRSEWPLALFTFLAATLFGMAAASAWAGLRVHPALFLTTAITAMAVSAAHLGKKWRAWRSVLNVRRSWLSREVTFFTLFVVTASAYLVLMPGERVMGWGAVMIGALGLLSIDMVYKFALRPSIRHSSGALLTGVLLAGVIMANPFVAVLAGMVKIGLYARRKIGFARVGLSPRPLVSAVRAGLGFVAPAALWAAAPDGTRALVVVAALVGELIDRCEFYVELETMTPARQMADDLQRRLRG